MSGAEHLGTEGESSSASWLGGRIEGEEVVAVAARARVSSLESDIKKGIQR